MLGAHQQLDAWTTALHVKQLEHVGFAVAHGKHSRLSADLARGVGGAVERFEPALRLAAFLLLFRKRLHRVEAQREHAERQARCGHRQRRVHVQAQARRRRLVRSDELQAIAAGTAREVQVRAVLDRQHRALAAHALDATLTVRREDVSWRDLRLRGRLDETVEGVDRGVVGAGSGVDLLPGIRRQKSGAPHQPCRKPSVSQRCSSELVLRPVLRVQALARFQRGRVIDGRNPQLPAPGAFQLVHEDRLHGLRAPFLPVLATAPGGRADAQEVGRAQAGSVISLVGEALNEIRAKAVAFLEVARQAAQDAPEHVAGQVRAAHRGADQETAQAHDALKMAPAPGVVPSDPAVPRRGPQRRGGKSRCPEPTVRRTDEVADLAAREGRHPVRVLACDQRVPQGPVRRVRDGSDPEAPYPRGMGWNSFGLGDILLTSSQFNK